MLSVDVLRADEFIERHLVLYTGKAYSEEGVHCPSVLSTSRNFYDMGHGHRAPRGQGERNVSCLHQT